jgi:hypothetical protein
MSDNLAATKSKDSLNTIKCKKIGDYILGNIIIIISKDNWKRWLWKSQNRNTSANRTKSCNQNSRQS